MLDLSGIGYFNPVFSFVLLFVIVYAVLQKTKIMGDSKPIQAVVAIILALIFVSVADVRGYVETVTPWFAVLVIGLFFVIFLAYFALKKPEDLMKPWVAWVFIALLALIFIYYGYHQFDVGSNSAYNGIYSWIRQPKVAGGLWLVIFGAIATFAITRKAS